MFGLAIGLFFFALVFLAGCVLGLLLPSNTLWLSRVHLVLGLGGSCFSVSIGLLAQIGLNEAIKKHSKH